MYHSRITYHQCWTFEPRFKGTQARQARDSLCGAGRSPRDYLSSLMQRRLGLRTLKDMKINSNCQREMLRRKRVTAARYSGKGGVRNTEGGGKECGALVSWHTSDTSAAREISRRRVRGSKRGRRRWRVGHSTP